MSFIKDILSQVSRITGITFGENLEDNQVIEALSAAPSMVEDTIGMKSRLDIIEESLKSIESKEQPSVISAEEIAKIVSEAVLANSQKLTSEFTAKFDALKKEFAGEILNLQELAAKKPNGEKLDASIDVIDGESKDKKPEFKQVKIGGKMVNVAATSK